MPSWGLSRIHCYGQYNNRLLDELLHLKSDLMEKPLWELWFAPAGWAYLMAEFETVPGLCHSKADERRQTVSLC